VDELHAKVPTLDDDLVAEVFYSENRATLNRREPDSARKTTELVMALWRKETDLKSTSGTRQTCRWLIDIAVRLCYSGRHPVGLASVRVKVLGVFRIGLSRHKNVILMTANDGKIRLKSE
jgi:hypothetical protein